tara:strand:- start:678 stop:1661 length:984 start_codon:yes stop_codon:yes gene_type:complete
MNINSIKKSDWYEDYIVHWRPTNMCNYDCSYCDSSNHLLINKSKLPSVENLINAARKIRDSIPLDKSILVYITGGEPFLIKDVHKWLDWMSENNMRVGIFTNGSLPSKIYDLSKQSFKNVNVKISFHPEFAEVDKIVELANTIKENNGNVEIRGMLAQGLFDKVFELESKIGDVPVTKLPVFPLYNQTLKKVNPTYSSSRYLEGYNQRMDDGDLGYYTEEELTIIKNLKQNNPEYLNIIINDEIKSNAVDLVTSRSNKFTGWKCGIVNKKILIQANGDIQYGACNNTGTIGNIFTDNVELFKEEWTICNKRTCTTLDEIMITKSKIS